MDENKYPREFLISLKDGSDVVLAPLHVHGGAIVGPGQQLSPIKPTRKRGANCPSQPL
jgi:hypothetical protein